MDPPPILGASVARTCNRRSAAFSFKFSPSHRLPNARVQWSARAGSAVRRRPGRRDVAQRSPSSPPRRAALPSRRALGGAKKASGAGKAAGLETEPCATATYQIHAHEEVAVIKEQAPQLGHAINLHAMPRGGNGEPNRPALVGEKPRTYKPGPR